MTHYFIQMSGVPGSGKSTIARGLTAPLNAIVLDHDDTKSAILHTGVENDLAGRASYEILRVLADRFLAQGFTVILDSPCLYVELLEYGQVIASQYGAHYRYIECRIESFELLNQRLLGRVSRPSQIKSLDGFVSHRGECWKTRTLFKQWQLGMQRPNDDYLVIDTTEAPKTCINRALAYVWSGMIGDAEAWLKPNG